MFVASEVERAVVQKYTETFCVRVPARLVIRGSAFSATITFVASPLLQASSPAVIGTLAASAAARIADDETEQTMYDDERPRRDVSRARATRCA